MDELNQPTVRDPMEVQRAHDLLSGIIAGETSVEWTARQRELFGQLRDVLCWVLRHDHEHFGCLLAQVEARMAAAGFRLAGPDAGRDSGR